MNLRADPQSLLERIRDIFLIAYQDSKRLPVFLEYYRTRASDVAFFGAIEASPLAIPTLAIGGRYAMGTAVGVAMQKMFKHCESTVFENSGHYPAQEEPVQFAERVIAFLESRSGA